MPAMPAMAQGADDMLARCLSYPNVEPLKYFNIIGTDATRRLLQCCIEGPQNNDISSAFIGPNARGASGIWAPFYNDASNLLVKMKQQCEDDETLRKGGWTPILFQWEIHFNQALSTMDLGPLVFADKSCRNFLLVGVFGSTWQRTRNTAMFYTDYNRLITQQAQHFFNLLHYLPMKNGVGFVRATYTTLSSPIWTTDFLTGIATSSTRPLPTRSTDLPPIIHLSSISDLVPSFNENNLKAIDSLIRWAKVDPIDQPKRNLVLAPIGRETTNRFVPGYIEREMIMIRDCPGCHLLSKGDLMSKCSGCYLTMYCSQKCQISHWKTHKKLCQFKRTADLW